MMVSLTASPSAKHSEWPRRTGASPHHVRVFFPPRSRNKSEFRLISIFYHLRRYEREKKKFPTIHCVLQHAKGSKEGFFLMCTWSVARLAGADAGSSVDQGKRRIAHTVSRLFFSSCFSVPGRRRVCGRRVSWNGGRGGTGTQGNARNKKEKKWRKKDLLPGENRGGRRTCGQSVC